MDLIKEGLAKGSIKLSQEGSSPVRGLIPPPKTRDELWKLVYHLWGIKIPRVRVCANHCAPFDAFADAFFARGEDGTPIPISVWHASRGFGGKSATLALLSLTEAVVLGTKTNLLGGSGEQSERVIKYMYGEEIPKTYWDSPQAPLHLIKGGFEKGALKKETILLNGGYVKALMASSRSVRGPHPERLRLDEVDEIELPIFDAAMGQTMALRPGIPAQTVCSSTWHYADGTMTEVLRRAKEKKWPIYQWCMRENHEDEGGWLPQSEIDRKMNETSKTMFQVEYELQEPEPGNRAIDPEAVDNMFRKDMGEFQGNMNEVCKVPFDKFPGLQKVHLVFGTGGDWAKRKDNTVIITFQEIPNSFEELRDLKRKDPIPLRVRLVEFIRTGRRPWPEMVGILEKRIKYYDEFGDSLAAHDQTGIGDVIQDYIQDDGRTVGLWLAGQLRSQVFNDYIHAIEHGWVTSPFIDYMESEHRYVSVDDLSGDGHPPDSFVAGAVAYWILKNRPRKRARATWGS